MRLIDADALIESIKHGLWDWETINGIESRTVLEQTIQDIRNEPTIDAEPVIRCKDCVYRVNSNCERFGIKRYTQADSFCSWGEMEEE